MKILGVIPARYASTRFPGKPLAMIGGRSMIELVYRGCNECTQFNTLIVATDDSRIYDHVVGFGGNVMMTDPNHPNGTSRMIEVYETIGHGKRFDWIINIQGDEPLINGSILNQWVDTLQKSKADIFTLVRKIENEDEARNKNIVKCVFSNSNRALYFSRSIIPFYREPDTVKTFYQHLGLYAFSAEIIPQIKLLSTSSLESAESLEQLRWLQNDLNIEVGITDYMAYGVDMPEDLEKIEKIISGKK